MPTPEYIYVMYSANLCRIKVTAEEAMKRLDKMNQNNLPTSDVSHEDFKTLENVTDYIYFLMQSPA